MRNDIRGRVFSYLSPINGKLFNRGMMFELAMMINEEIKWVDSHSSANGIRVKSFPLMRNMWLR